MDDSIPGFRLRTQVGSDAIGLWFDAEQISLERKLTVKVLKPEFAEHEVARREFLAEMDRVAQLTHNNLLQVVDTIREGTLALVTDRIGHKTLAMQLADGKPLGKTPSLRFARGVAKALHYLAGEGFAHKSVTPRLITFREDGGIRLVTFRYVIPIQEQIALKGRLAQDPHYVAPEQIMGEEPVGPNTPCYQIAALLFHMLAGKPPHGGDSQKEIAKAHMTKPFPSLKRSQPFLEPKGIYDLIAACTVRSPADRPTLEEVIDGLDALMRGEDPGIEPPAAREDGPVRLRSRRRRRRRRR